MSKMAFKVWSRDRSIRKAMCSSPNVEELIKKASTSLGINGTKLVLESDGTNIEDEESLVCFSKEALILLADTEEWTPGTRQYASPCGYYNIKQWLLSQRKMAINLKAGSNLQPNDVSADDIEDSVEFKKRWLMDMSDNTAKEHEEKITNYMKATYQAQRAFLVNSRKPPSVDDIKKEWPFLTHKEHIYNHFDQLTNTKINAFEKSFKENRDKIIDFGKTDKSDKISTIFSNSEDSDKDLLCLQFIFAYFDEDINFLMRKYSAEHFPGIIEIEAETMAPWIAAVETVNDPKITNFHIFVERKHLNSNSDSVIDAVQQAFACFYVYNMQYPKEVTKSMEFMQKYFATINNSENKKKKRKSNISKVDLLIADIRKFNN